MLGAIFLVGGVLGSSLIHEKCYEPSAPPQSEFNTVSAVCFLTPAEVIRAENVTPLLANPVTSSTSKEEEFSDNALFLSQPELTWIQKLRLNGACCWQHATCQTFEYCDDWAIKRALENRFGPRCNNCLPSCSIDCAQVRERAWNCCVATDKCCHSCMEECAKQRAQEHCPQCHDHRYHRFNHQSGNHRSGCHVNVDIGRLTKSLSHFGKKHHSWVSRK